MLLRIVLTLTVLVAAAAEWPLPAAVAAPRLKRVGAEKRATLIALRGGAEPEEDEEAKRVKLEMLRNGEIPPGMLGTVTEDTTARPERTPSGIKVIGVSGEAEKEPVARLPDVDVHNIAKFDNWDHRECCVGNAHQWKDYMNEFLTKPKADIPKKMHQIWIGPKVPPIVWCDSWRKSFRSQYPGWEYKLWTDHEVSKLNLRTQEFFDKEHMFQCKADLLRLEILWEEGGIYIDADMVWLHKDLQDVLNAGKDTGFFCGFEPDTKDKPYSVIGNSFIACTPRHPLVDMLIKYIRAVYDHKRPYNGVEWVTGPLAFTKCISHTQMPFFVPPQIWFYPKFHYVPNPDAINLADFPESYAFQFGYTCSGLEGWVANSINNVAVDHFWIDKCPQLRDRNWPMGRVKTMPAIMGPGADAGAEENHIPKIIHQFAFSGSKPEHLIKTWAQDFCAANEGWEYRCHSWFPDLHGEYFGCSMYSPNPWGMGPVLMECFALEVLYNQGGYHVPLSLPWQKNSTVLGLQGSGTEPVLGQVVTPEMDPSKAGNAFSPESIESGFVEDEALGIVGAGAGSKQLLRKIKTLLDKSDTWTPCKAVHPRMLLPLDSQTSYMDYPDWSRYLGAEMFFDVCDHDESERDLVWLASTFKVPMYGLPRKHFSALKGMQGRFVAVTNRDLYLYRSLSDAIPGFIQGMDKLHGPQGWHFICLVLQWKAGKDAPALEQVQSEHLPDPYDSRFVGFIANSGAGAMLPDLVAQKENFEYEDLVEVWRGIVKLHGTKHQGKPAPPRPGSLTPGDNTVKVAYGFRKWQWAADDPRAKSDDVDQFY
uniref:Alpha 1,4-glycosyltransferase domain-containing protein n=1 Tax=Hemiselmis andersenii TaxID=464988 RepID=A0A6U5AHR0_HEMAN|mmetsp:Transcript_48154/g.116992  ORF Transcript_48154/g.116992 Transcript_48154/m.116992 type:complete len:817 (+) Transcript_48154:229-2679(+)